MLAPAQSQAGWLFGDSTGVGRSGLNLDHGYDRNTVVTVTGRVAAVPAASSDPLTVELSDGTDNLVVVLGPRWYLQDDTLEWQAGDLVTVRGSRAQGMDGRSYLLAQWISTPGGGQLVLRNDAGRPGWSGGRRGERQGMGGSMQRGSGRKGR
ncbi:MAG: OB-fold nucleic acid binding domain-containing protein [Trichlorobacter sp.]